MKKIYSFLLAILITASLLAQPQKMSYQAVIRDAGNTLVANHSVGMRVSILQGSSSGTVIYTETQTPTTNSNGLVTIEIGAGTIVTGTFAGIDWSTGTYFIKTETDPTGGLTYTINGTSQLLSVPYALFAKSAEIIAEPQNLMDILTIGNDAGGKLITNIANPINNLDAANKKYVDGLLMKLGFLPNNYVGTIQDIDGNVYKVVKIGTQTWMAENLRTSKFNDGTNIPMITDNIDWSNMVSPAFCYMQNESYQNPFGALYNWHAVITMKLCPVGWRVPTDLEWATLSTFLGGDINAGPKLREKGSIAWKYPVDGTNESGFTALPGGARNADGSFTTTGGGSYFWDFAQSSFTFALYHSLYSNGQLMNGTSNMKAGLEIRCIKDN